MIHESGHKLKLSNRDIIRQTQSAVYQKLNIKVRWFASCNFALYSLTKIRVLILSHEVFTLFCLYPRILATLCHTTKVLNNK